MRYAEDQEKGLFAMSVDDSGDNVRRFGRMKYDGGLRLFVPDCILSFDQFVTYSTKRHAIETARRLGYPANHVEKVGTRFWSAWGIRHDFRDRYFLALFD